MQIHIEMKTEFKSFTSLIFINLVCRHGLVAQSWSGRSTVLQSSSPSNPEDLNELLQVCLIRVGADLCRTVDHQEQDWAPLV